MSRDHLSEFERDILEAAAEDDYGLWELNPAGWKRARDRELIRHDVLRLLRAGLVQVVVFDPLHHRATAVSMEQARRLIRDDEHWRVDIGADDVQVRVRATAAGEAAIRNR